MGFFLEPGISHPKTKEKQKDSKGKGENGKTGLLPDLFVKFCSQRMKFVLGQERMSTSAAKIASIIDHVNKEEVTHYQLHVPLIQMKSENVGSFVFL